MTLRILKGRDNIYRVQRRWMFFVWEQANLDLACWSSTLEGAEMILGMVCDINRRERNNPPVVIKQVKC